jgi:ABC-type taurine transport system substrate-binding protein
MTSKTYDSLPSTAIERIVIDTAANKVEVVYKSSEKPYTYSAENAESFDQQFLAEFDTEDFSVGRFINSNVSSGNLTLLTN